MQQYVPMKHENVETDFVLSMRNTWCLISSLKNVALSEVSVTLDDDCRSVNNNKL